MDGEYLYCINDMGNEDFITTSFEYFNDSSRITIYNFNQEIDMSKVAFAAIDYALDVFVSFNKKYTNSNRLKFYSVTFVEQDLDRKTVILKLDGIKYDFDLLSHKRGVKINNIIN
mgnify:CR=1 FL=1